MANNKRSNPRKPRLGAASSQSRSRLRGEKKGGGGKRKKKKKNTRSSSKIASSVWDITKDSVINLQRSTSSSKSRRGNSLFREIIIDPTIKRISSSRIFYLYTYA